MERSCSGPIRPLAFLACIAGLLALSPFRVSAAEMYAYSHAIVDRGDGSGYGESLESLTGNASASFQSIHPYENEELTAASMGAFARAGFGSLKASASVNLTNAFSGFGYVGPQEEVYPFGWTARAIASTKENLIFGGFATNYTSTFYYYATGDINGGSAKITFAHGGTSSSEEFSGNVLFGRVLKSSTYINNAPQAIFFAELDVNAQINSQNVPEPGGVNLSAYANLGATLTLIGVDLRDENGNLMPQGTLTSDSGFVIPIIDGNSVVPEASSIWLASTAIVGCLGWRRRRAKRA